MIFLKYELFGIVKRQNIIDILDLYLFTLMILIISWKISQLICTLNLMENFKKQTNIIMKLLQVEITILPEFTFIMYH